MYAVKDHSASFVIWSFFLNEDDQVSFSTFLAEMPEMVPVVMYNEQGVCWCKLYSKDRLMEEAG